MDLDILPIKNEVITSIDGAVKGSTDDVIFHCASGRKFRMFHLQDRHEKVWLEDICGNIADLIGSPLIMAESVSEKDDDAPESGTWTFIKFATVKGYVTFRWCGHSNGFYSERVDFGEIKPNFFGRFYTE